MDPYHRGVPYQRRGKIDRGRLPKWWFHAILTYISANFRKFRPNFSKFRAKLFYWVKFGLFAKMFICLRHLVQEKTEPPLGAKGGYKTAHQGVCLWALGGGGCTLSSPNTSAHLCSQGIFSRPKIDQKCLKIDFLLEEHPFCSPQMWNNLQSDT